MQAPGDANAVAEGSGTVRLQRGSSGVSAAAHTASFVLPANHAACVFMRHPELMYEQRLRQHTPVLRVSHGAPPKDTLAEGCTFIGTFS